MLFAYYYPKEMYAMQGTPMNVESKNGPKALQSEQMSILWLEVITMEL
jgi:hypothetical protein